MEISNKNHGNPNILSGNKQGGDGQGKTDQDKENVNTLKNEQLHDTEKPQPDQEMTNNLERSKEQNENEDGKNQ